MKPFYINAYPLILRVIFFSLILNCNLQKKIILFKNEFPVNFKVIASGGLVLREHCDQNTKRILLIPFLSTFTAERIEKEETIDNITNNWYYGNYQDQQGCVFGGYLHKGENSLDYNQTKIQNKIFDYIVAEKYDSALSELEFHSPKLPINGKLLAFKAEINLNLIKYSECVDNINNALLYSSEFPVLFQIRALCNQKLGKTDAADLDFRLASSLSKNYYAPLFYDYCFDDNLNEALTKPECKRILKYYPFIKDMTR